MVWVGVYPEDSEVGIPPYYTFARELSIRSVFMSPYTFPRSVAMLPKLELKPLISDIIPLDDIEKAFALHEEGEAVKILIKP